MPRRLPKKAFEFYVGLGDERTYAKVGERYGVAVRTVTRLARDDNWRLRLRDIEQRARRVTNRRLLNEKIAALENEVPIHNFVKASALKALKDYPIKSAATAVRALEIANHGLHISLQMLEVAHGERDAMRAHDEAEARREEFAEEIADDEYDFDG